MEIVPQLTAQGRDQGGPQPRGHENTCVKCCAEAHNACLKRVMDWPARCGAESHEGVQKALMLPEPTAPGQSRICVYVWSCRMMENMHHIDWAIMQKAARKNVLACKSLSVQGRPSGSSISKSISVRHSINHLLGKVIQSALQPERQLLSNLKHDQPLYALLLLVPILQAV